MHDTIYISECLTATADVINDYLNTSPRIVDQLCNVKSLSELKAIHMTLNSSTCSLLKKEIETAVINHYENRPVELCESLIASDCLTNDFDKDSDIAIFINNDIHNYLLSDEQLVDNVFNWGVSIHIANTGDLLDRITQAIELPNNVRINRIKCVGKTCISRLSDGTATTHEIVPVPLNDMFGALFSKLFINLTNDIDKNKMLTCGNVSCARFEISDLGLSIVGGAFFGKDKS